MNGAGRGRGTFRKIICGTRRGGFANPTGRVPRGIKISCPAHLWCLVHTMMKRNPTKIWSLDRKKPLVNQISAEFFFVIVQRKHDIAWVDLWVRRNPLSDGMNNSMFCLYNSREHRWHIYFNFDFLKVKALKFITLILFFTIAQLIDEHSKKIGFLPNPQKCSSRCTESRKWVFRSTKLLKVLSVYPGEEPFGYKTFLSSVEQKKGFVGKSETCRVSYKSLMVSYWTPVKTLEFNTEPSGINTEPSGIGTKL